MVSYFACSGSSILSSQVKIEQPEILEVSNLTYSSSSNFQSIAITDEKSFPLVLNECGGDDTLMHHEVSAALQLSPDPAKFVLDMIQGLYSQHLKKVVTGFDAIVMRNKVLLLE